MPEAKADLTDRQLRGLKPAPKGMRYELADARVPGLRARVSDQRSISDRAGSVTFVLYGRFPPSTKPTRRKLGSYPQMSLSDARELARSWKSDIDRGHDPKKQLASAEKLQAEIDAAAQSQLFRVVLNDFLSKYVDDLGLLSSDEIRRAFESQVLPKWGEMSIVDVGRGHVTALLDGVAERSGPVAADKLLAYLSKLFNWHATRVDAFTSPIVRGMARTNPKDRARSRVLDNREIRALWRAADASSTFGAFIKVALLTGQRRAKVAEMKWTDIDERGNWTIPYVPREKGNPGDLLLPPFTLAIIRKQPLISGNPYVFAGKNGAAISGFSKFKAAFDALMIEELGGHMKPWIIHDLRRTARTTMASCGVSPEISRRVLGHAISGVDRIYDQYKYAPQRATAVSKISKKISKMVG